MAHNVSNEYKQIIYSGDARNKLKLLFNNVELEEADRYCEKMTIKSRIVPNGAKIFSLNNFISKEVELILHDIDTSIIQDQVSISIGTLVGNNYEYVPIGIFNIQNQPTNDKNKTTIKLRDNSVKFDFNYNAQPLIEENGGSATKLQILQDICTQAGVTCNITSFIGYLDEIGIYDNTVTARKYIADIAEQAGKIATINRSGELIFVDLNNLTTWEIPIEVVEKYESGTKFKVGKVVYEDGIVRYETEDSNDDTLFLDGSNNYINNELVKNESSSNDNKYYLENTGEADLVYLELEGNTAQDNTPTPDNPSELVGVGIKNLYDYTDVAFSSSGITTDDDGWITITYDNSSGSSTSYRNYYTNNLDLKTSSNYYLLAEIKSVSGTGSINVNSSATNAGQFTSGSNYNFSSLENGSKILLLKTTKSDFTNIIYGIRSFATFTAGQSGSITFRLSVYETATNDYIPYGKYGVEVKTIGKNLLENTATTQTISGITFTKKADGSVLVNGTATATINTYKIATVSLKTGTYTLSGCASGGSARTYRLVETNGFFVDIGNGSTKEVTALTSYSFYIQIYNGAVCNNLTFKPQLEKGNTSTEYEPYQGNTYLYTLDEPLRGIGNTKDKLFIENNTLKVERKIGSIVLDGSENWGSDGTLTNTRRCTLALSDVKQNDASNSKLSNRFVYNWNYNLDEPHFYIGQAGVLYIFSTESSLANFKTWLSTNNTKIVYPLETTYTEEIGQVQIPSTYEGITHIDISSNIDTNTYLQYRKDKTQVEAILGETNQFDIDSLKTGKILGNPAIDSYDLIQIHDTYKDKTYTTLATNDLVYTGVLINTFDTQIGEEAKEQNVTINGETTFRKWAKTSIDNVEGSINLQAGEIDEANGKINATNLTLNSQGALLNVIANNSNIDVEYDSDGNPLSGEIREVTTTTGFTFNADGMTIADTQSNFKALHKNTGTYYYDGENVVGQYTKDGSKQKDLQLFGVYYYGMDDKDDIPMFVAELFTDENGNEGFGHFYNRGD